MYKLEHSETALLIGRCREGDAIALGELIHAYLPFAHRLAVSILNDPAEADDAAQEALVKAIRKLDSYRGEASFTTWLYAITLNVCRSRLRKRRARGRLMQVLHTLFRIESADRIDPEQTTADHETQQLVWQAVQALDDRQREVIVLRYYHDLRLNDIAHMLSVNERTVRNRLSAARDRLRVELKGKVDWR